MNNPVSLIDPLGLDSCKPIPGNNWCQGTTHTTVCYGMVCADQYYGGSFFEGYTGPSMAGICIAKGKAGYCGNDMFDSVNLQGNDIFDAIGGQPGTYLTLGTTGMIGFGFDDQLWSQTWGFIDSSGGHAPTSGYVQYQTWSPIQSATSRAPGDNVQKTGFINKLYGTIDAVTLSNAQGKPMFGPYVDVTEGNISITTYSVTWTYTPLGSIPSVSSSVSNWPFP